VESRTWTEPSRGASALNFTETTVYNNSGTNYGTVQKITRSGGSGAELEFWENTPTYDALQRVTSSATRMQVGQNLPVTLTQSTAYDAKFGRVKQITYPASAIDGAPVSVYQRYNALGLLDLCTIASLHECGSRRFCR
jgi:hypothetical protein